MSSRRKFVGGNWKMNGSVQLVDQMAVILNEAAHLPNVDIVVAPPALYSPLLKSKISPPIKLAAQNVHEKVNGAYTGETSVSMLKDLGLDWAIIGHSERRKYNHESDEEVGRKLKAVMESGNVGAILCIGESLEEREAGKTETVVIGQLFNALEQAEGLVDSSRLVIAYEPVWAIGTGRVATSAQAQSVHSALRHSLASKLGKESSDAIRIIYGGSVTAANVGELSACPDIDGFLVGGASLKPEFLEIIKSCSSP